MLDKDARNYVMNEIKQWPKVAVITTNTGQKLMGQIVINLTGYKNKIKLFESEVKAIEWLNVD